MLRRQDSLVRLCFQALQENRRSEQLGRIGAVVTARRLLRFWRRATVVQARRRHQIRWMQSWRRQHAARGAIRRWHRRVVLLRVVNSMGRESRLAYSLRHWKVLSTVPLFTAQFTGHVRADTVALRSLSR